MFACLHGQGPLTALAFEFSPVVEQTAADTVTLDASGLDRLFGLPRMWPPPWPAAPPRSGSRPTSRSPPIPMPPSAPRADFPASASSPMAMKPSFWRPLPVALLAPLRRVAGDAGALGHPPLPRSGRAAAAGHRRASRPRRFAPARTGARRGSTQAGAARRSAAVSKTELELEYPVELLEPLAFLLARLLNGLATTPGHARPGHQRIAPAPETRKPRHARAHPAPARAVARYQGVPEAAAARSHGASARRAHRARMAGDEPREAAGRAERPVHPRCARAGEAGADPGAAEVHRRANPASAPPSCWTRTGPTRSKWRTHSCVPRRYSCRRTAGLCVPALSFRIFRPPRTARVALASGQPSFVAAEGIRGKILDLAGPWRTSGDWWTSDPWLRDEWDIALSDGALYRLYCCPKGWFVEGSYD